MNLGGRVEWSPSGRHILFTCDAGVCVLDLEDNSVTKAPFCQRAGSSMATWSPDGSRIAVLAYAGAALYIMDPDGTGACLIPTSDDVADALDGLSVCSRGVPSSEQ